MNKAEFLEIIKNPGLLNDKSLLQLQEIVNEYPFFQAGRMLLVKNMHKLDHIRYNSELKHSAVYIADRTKLFFLVNDIGVKDKKPNIITESIHKFKGNNPPAEDNAEELDQTASTEKDRNADLQENSSELEGIPIEDVSSRLNVSATDNYLDADDDYIDDVGSIYNFSIKNEERNNPLDEEMDDIVFPSADLLDYESTSSGMYVLPNLEALDDVSQDDNRSFSDWLHIMRYSPSEKNKEKSVSIKGMDLINNFLNAQPKIVPSVSKKHKNIDLAEEREQEEEDILSETLANIYIKQGYKSKAIAIFEKLRLKYPEKMLTLHGELAT